MPYIKEEQRKCLSNMLAVPSNAGELNYCFTELIIRFLTNKGTNYQAINDVIGALEGAKLEFYRRVASPYENQKISENGDVYPESKQK